MGVAMQLWETLEHSIVHYTGLSPAVFFTAMAVALAFYYVVSGLFASPPPPPRRREIEAEPLPPPVQIGEVTKEELRAYDGSDLKKPLLMAIKGQIYDVSSGSHNSCLLCRVHTRRQEYNTFGVPVLLSLLTRL